MYLSTVIIPPSYPSPLIGTEYKKNLQSDSRRVYQLLKSSSDPLHPFNRFDTGNWETLRDQPREMGLVLLNELKQFHRRYYSANLMKVVLLGRESLDTLESLAREKCKVFYDIKDIIGIFEDHLKKVFFYM